MATTSIWHVKGWLGAVVIYVEDPAKTASPEFFQLPDMSDEDTQGLADVMAYATRPDKTEQRLFVSGINCDPASAREDMMAVKRGYEKDGGIVAWHGYQSFAPGEATPEIAHEIGVKLAKRLWGDSYQVVVATHLDKGHIHNHLVLNSVSCMDGRRYHRTAKDYHDLRTASDELCYEYGLSVIESPKRGRSKHYAEWQAEREGRPTWRAIVKKDVDEAIEKAMTDRHFFENLKALGYEIKQGKDISVRPPGKERFVRLARNFGDEYTLDGIRQRILTHRDVRRPVSRSTGHGSQSLKKMPSYPKGSILALHRHYLYLFGFHKQGNASNNQSARTHFLLREELLHIDELMADEKLLADEGIETDLQLSTFKDRLISELAEAIEERSQLKSAIRTEADKSSYSTKDNPQYQQLNERIRKLRREVRQCERIEARSGSLEERVRRIEKDSAEQPRKEEGKKHGRIRTGSRAAGQDDAARD